METSGPVVRVPDPADYVRCPVIGGEGEGDHQLLQYRVLTAEEGLELLTDQLQPPAVLPECLSRPGWAGGEAE